MTVPTSPTPLADPCPQHRGEALAGAAIASTFEQALQLQHQGRRSESEILCSQVVDAQPLHSQAWHLKGVLALQRGALDDGIEHIRRSLAINALQAGAYSNLGGALLSQRRPAEALTCFEEALRQEPELVHAHLNRGIALTALDRPCEALAAFERALAQQPALADAHKGRGAVLLALGKDAQALASYEWAAELAPHDPETHYSRGNALFRLGRAADAVAAYDRALGLQPQFAEALNNRSTALLLLKRPADALASCEEALRLRPDFASAHISRGNVLRELERYRDAVSSYDRALELRPEHCDALTNGAAALSEIGEHEGALARFDRALAVNPNHVIALINRAQPLSHLKRHREAAQALARALELDPGQEAALGHLVHCRQHCYDWRGWRGNVASIIERVNAGKPASRPMDLLAMTDGAAEQLECARMAAARTAASVEPLWRGERYAHERIRVAYVSANFGNHPVSHLLAGVFEQHDRKRFEVFGIWLGGEGASLTQRIRAALPRYLDVSARTGREIAVLLRELEIDIAIDLHGYTQGARKTLFASRPAPVQVNYLGYPGTMGSGHWDYVLADDFVIPPGSERFYAEKVIYLPECFQANDDQPRLTGRRPSRAEAGLPENAFVFCSFNNSYKVTAGQFDIWCRLLAAVAHSVLWIVADNEDAQDNLRREASARGVAAERLIFAQRMEYPEHLARLPLADLFLDTLPFNAGTTASDALWAGVPVLTCSGEALASRMAGSLLRTLSLPELITHTPQDYEALALRLARSPGELAALRARLAVNRDTGPLFDTERFCRHLERAYIGMWERAERGEVPQSFAVEPIAPVEKRRVAPPAVPVRAMDDALLTQAVQQQQRGDLKAAEALLRRLLQAAPQHRDALHRLGALCVQTQRAEEGMALIRESLRIDPAQPAAHMHLGIALRRAGRTREAIACFDHALVLKQDLAEALYNRGNALTDLGRLEEAVADLEAALRFRPQFLAALGRLSELLVQLARYPEALTRCAQIVQQVPEDDSTPCELLALRGNALRELGRAEEALQSFERALRLDQDSAALWNDRALVLRDLKRIDEALESSARALRLAPDFAEAFSNQADALRDARRFSQALASYDAALRLKSRLGVAHRGRGVTLRALGRVSEALSAFDEAARAGANQVDLLNQRGNAFLDLERFEEALACFERALELMPDQADLLWNRGAALRKLKRYGEATECYARLKERSPSYELVLGLVMHCRLERCDWQDYAATREQILRGLAPDVRVVEPFTLLTLTDSAAAQLQCARNYAARNRPTAELPVLPAGGYRHRRIRLAYVSADLREHALSYLMAGVFERHDRERFEVIALSLRPADASPMGRRLQGAFDRFIDVSRRTEAEVAACVRELEVDIAVDLMGYTQHQKSAVFGYRPAPVQVAYLGYPGTTGAAALDYIIADEFVIPPEQRHHYSEQVVYLPGCFQANDDQRTAVPTPTRAAVGLPDDALVFCCFNNNGKHSPPLFDIWCRLLAKVPGSVLWLIAGSEEIRGNLRREAARRGTDPARLVFAGSLAYPLHLARVALADLFLDTFPFSAGATASDALWAGVPLLTCVGEAYASRMAGSLLHALGLPELVTGSLEEYADRALALAGDPSWLATLRSRLQEGRRTRGVFDTTHFCRRMERAYLAMMERMERGEPPQSFSVH